MFAYFDEFNNVIKLEEKEIGSENEIAFEREVKNYSVMSMTKCSMNTIDLSIVNTNLLYRRSVKR